MKRLIVNADDFGLCPGTVSGIIHGHQNGIITSTSLMLTMPSSMAAAAAAYDCPDLDVGVHLTFSEGFPVLSAEWLPTLVDEFGRFRSAQDWLASGEQPNLDQLAAEFRAQLSLPRQIRLRVSHLDLHMSLGYLFPEVFALTVELASEYGLAMRFPFGEGWEGFFTAAAAAAGVPEQTMRATVEGYQMLVADRHIVHPDRFREGFPAGRDAVASLVELISNLGEGSTEMLTHPGFAEDCRMYMGDMADRRGAELEALCDPAVRRAIDDAGIELVNFRQL